METPRPNTESINRYGVWNVQPDVLKGFFANEGLSSEQIDGIPLILGDSRTTELLQNPPSQQDHMVGTLWVNRNAVDAVFVNTLKQWNEYGGAYSLEQIKNFTEWEVNKAVLEAAQFAAKIARGENVDPGLSRSERDFNVGALTATALLLRHLNVDAHIPLDPDGSRLIADKAVELSSYIARKKEARAASKKEETQRVPDFLKFWAFGSVSRGADFEKPGRGDIATFIAESPNETIVRNIKHKVLERDAGTLKKLKLDPTRLATSLGLNNDLDVVLLSDNLVVRILRYRIYDLESLKSSPSADLARKLRKKGIGAEDLIAQGEEHATNYEDEIERLIASFSTSEGDTRRARKIGYAVTDLIGRIDPKKGDIAKAKATSKVIKEWSERWRSDLSL